ncbi:myosin heavy chain kinase D-like [Agrilus planipennis]|uniref:Myosin heavy chain kinase D-like n=1 Tax=Agrilus planipennis TaxID=224129 RepID=A0A1W4X7Y1_AGRPL|nr:myosin heavy chain kinase D-like [Agrilus planipennis]XP_018332203.1 myosin heavy chain kinase D-like [Agrilus planipennis]XP_018332204.1 myosin heavy chain kinase D-like [Agrilus planipennis]XP_018332205.1 myosin heavy chain kinase D-like [Agrilus planipennis]XP_018332206.1 myosin heavy chain kinase D-like [Agrilus planipennis]
MTLSIKCRADDNDKHSSDVSCLLHHKSKLYSAADDGKIKVWSNDLKLLGTVEAHPCSVFSLTASEDTIYSCSNDGTIKSWTLDLQEKGLVYKGETEIWKVLYVNGILYAGDDQGDVMLFKNDKFFCGINILEPVKDMIIVGNVIYAIRDIYLTMVEIHIKEDGKGMYSIIKSVHGRGPINLTDGKLFFMNREGKGLVVIESSKEKQYKEVAQLDNAHDLIINTIFAERFNNVTKIYTGGWDKLIKEWTLSPNNKIEPGRSCSVDFSVSIITSTGDGKILFAAGGDGHLVAIDIS